MKRKSILKMTADEARKFLLKNDSYCNIDLPKYFNFENVLKKAEEKIRDKDVNSYFSKKTKANGKTCSDSPKNYEGVNYRFLNNKDGKYAWRPMELIHPVLYVSLVNLITSEENWKSIKERFKYFREDENITCVSLPIDAGDGKKDKAASINKWWRKFEQKSLELSLDYDYLISSDITNCYGAIYTHSIAWALHDRDVAKEKKSDKTLLGNKIDDLIRGMSYGQTNGIPQGSVLMDFIAEILLGYVDSLIAETLEDNGTTSEYQILRYRDDYRIFVNTQKDGEEILKVVSEVLSDLGLKLNRHKTVFSDDVIKHSFKQGKLDWIQLDSLVMLNKSRKKRKILNLQKHILLIYLLAEEHPNCGSLKKALFNYYERKDEFLKHKKRIKSLIGILVDIAIKNPATYDIVSAILSEMIDVSSNKHKEALIDKIIRKFDNIPNTEHLKIWLQRMTLKIDDTLEYDVTLCDKVMDSDVKIWNSDWLKDSLKEIIESIDIINRDLIDKMPKTIEKDEVEIFRRY